MNINSFDIVKYVNFESGKKQKEEYKFSWYSYLLQCRSDECFEIHRQKLFNEFYKGHVIEWEGCCTLVGKSALKFLMSPTESGTYSNSDVKLKRLPNDTDAYERNKLYKFKGRLFDYSKILDHLLEFVQKSDKVDDISWLQFVFLFGSRCREFPEKLFNQWKGFFKM
jgi:hypothetical protein